MENNSEVQRRRSRKLPSNKLPRHRSRGRPIPPTRMMRQLWRRIIQSITTKCFDIYRNYVTNVLPGNSWIAVLNTPTAWSYYSQTANSNGTQVICSFTYYLRANAMLSLPYLVITVFTYYSSPGLPQIHSDGFAMQDSLLIIYLESHTAKHAHVN